MHGGSGWQMCLCPAGRVTGRLVWSACCAWSGTACNSSSCTTAAAWHHQRTAAAVLVLQEPVQLLWRLKSPCCRGRSSCHWSSLMSSLGSCWVHHGACSGRPAWVRSAPIHLPVWLLKPAHTLPAQLGQTTTALTLLLVAWCSAVAARTQQVRFSENCCWHAVGSVCSACLSALRR